MSRGLGRKQRHLLRQLKHKSLTFTEIERDILGSLYPEFALKPTAKRSWRRALQKLVEAKLVMATGHGGHGDPYRYHFDPMAAAIVGTKGDFDALIARIKASESTG